jgi:hypothetical protein
MCFEANEAVRLTMRNKNKGELLNSKSEFNHPPLGRIIVKKEKNVKNYAKNRLKLHIYKTLNFKQ